MSSDRPEGALQTFKARQQEPDPRKLLGKDERDGLREEAQGLSRDALIQTLGWFSEHADAMDVTVAQLRAGNQLQRDFISQHLGICIDCLGTGNHNVYDGTASCGSCKGTGNHHE